MKLLSVFNTILSEQSSEQEIDTLAQNFIDTMSGSIKKYNNWRVNPDYVHYFEESGIDDNMATRIYNRALELGQ